jgi:hypothetical protein
VTGSLCSGQRATNCRLNNDPVGKFVLDNVCGVFTWFWGIWFCTVLLDLTNTPETHTSTTRTSSTEELYTTRRTFLLAKNVERVEKHKSLQRNTFYLILMWCSLRRNPVIFCLLSTLSHVDRDPEVYLNKTTVAMILATMGTDVSYVGRFPQRACIVEFYTEVFPVQPMLESGLE